MRTEISRVDRLANDFGLFFGKDRVKFVALGLAPKDDRVNVTFAVPAFVLVV